MGFPRGSESKEFACNAGGLDPIRGSGRSPGGGNDNPLQYFLPGESYGLRSLMGYRRWGHKELGMTERLTLSRSTFFYKHILGFILYEKFTYLVPKMLKWFHRALFQRNPNFCKWRQERYLFRILSTMLYLTWNSLGNTDLSQSMWLSQGSTRWKNFF